MIGEESAVSGVLFILAAFLVVVLIMGFVLVSHAFSKECWNGHVCETCITERKAHVEERTK